MKRRQKGVFGSSKENKSVSENNEIDKELADLKKKTSELEEVVNENFYHAQVEVERIVFSP
jgi:hypothetical protein